jgi:hypothetical protein
VKRHAHVSFSFKYRSVTRKDLGRSRRGIAPTTCKDGWGDGIYVITNTNNVVFIKVKKKN